MNNEKETSVAFTGYREEKILRSKKRSFFSSLISIGQDKKLLKDISELTYNAVERLYEKGCVNFYTGMSEGYDMIGALSVLQLRDQHPDIKLIAVVPFKGQDNRYSQRDKDKYEWILSEADEVVILAERYIENSQFLRRNDYMLDRVDNIICYYDGQRGGTMYTYNRAVKRGMQIINICDAIRK